MPLSRQEVRQNLITLIQYQIMREREYGELLLTAWYDISDDAQDVFLLQVWEKFAEPGGAGRGVFRFPGMGNIWLPGLYIVSTFSRAEFEIACSKEEELVMTVRRQLHLNAAEILWPQETDKSAIAGLLLL